jgi:hypothetical protein
MKGQGFWSAHFQLPAAAGIGVEIVPQHMVINTLHMVSLFIPIVICTKIPLYYIFSTKIPIQYNVT